MPDTTNIQQPKKKRDRIGVILYLAYIAMLAGAVLLIARILWLQIFFQPRPEIAQRLTPSTTVRTIEPERGKILDCEGRLLAISCPEYQFYMDCTVLKDSNTPEEEREWRAKARELSRGLAREFPEKTADQFYNLIITNRDNEKKPGRKYVKIGHPVERPAFKRILELPLFNEGRYKSGVQYEQENVREYPYGTLARRTIGFVRNNKSPVKNTHIGLEGKFDYELHGEEGREYLRRTDQGTVINSDSTMVRAVDGNDLRTTINIDYQEIADMALRAQIEPEEALEGACLVLMETKTGAIRAMVNLLREGEEHDGAFSEIQNLAIGRKNEPGSVFKTVTLTSLLNDGYVKSLEETLPATDGHVDGTAITDTHIPDFARKHNTDKISVIDGFKISSNYVFAKLAVDNYARNSRGDLTEKFLSNLYTYKLGETFDFDLDGMLTPTIPSPETRYWTDTDLASIAYGYSTSMTPMHILTFYNAIANKGKMMKPYLVEDIESQGKVIRRRGPSTLNAAMCSRAVADTVTRALKAVTEEGTARALRGAKCAVAGKTGTSFGTFEDGRYSDDLGRRKYQGTFVGFFPADNPKYSVICTVYSKPTSKSFQGGGIPARTIRAVIDRLYNIDLDLSENGNTR